MMTTPTPKPDHGPQTPAHTPGHDDGDPMNKPDLPGGELGDNPVPEIAPDAPVEIPDIDIREIDLPLIPPQGR